MKKNIIDFFRNFLTLLSLAYFVYSSTGHSHEIEPHDDNIIPLHAEQIQQLEVCTEKAKAGTLSLLLSARGKIIIPPDQMAHILPKVSGIAQEACKNMGDKTHSGDLLAILESHEMADTKAHYLASVEKEKLSYALLEREQRLHEKKITAEQDYLNAQSAYQEAKIQENLNKQKLRSFGLTDQEIEDLRKQKDPDVRFYTIRSPMSGVIIDRHITKGEYIQAGSTIYEIANLDKVWIDIGIFPKDLSKIKEGQIVYIENAPSHADVAKIIYISPVIGEDTITSKIIAQVSNSQGIWHPGTFVKVNIAIESIPVRLMIPKEAVQEIEGKSVVFIKVGEGFEKRDVVLGRSDEHMFEVLSGLNSGEEYASSNTFFLKAELGKHEAEHSH